MRRTVFIMIAISTLTGFAQTANQAQPTVSTTAIHEPYSSFATATPDSDPADSVCYRRPAGAIAGSPNQLVSSGGILELNLYYKTAVDENGLTRYCYISDAGYEAPTLRVYPGDQLIIHFHSDLPTTTATSTSAMPAMVMKPDATATTSDCSATTVTSTSTNLHFHGLNVAPVCHQDDVIHTIIPPSTEFDYTVQIPSNEPSGMYWYHPHPHGFSQNQVLGGATGIIIVEGIQNFNSAVAGLPERVLVIRDQKVVNSGSTAPGNDLSVNYVPVTYPSYVPAVLQTPPSTKEFWRVANTSANSLIDLYLNYNNIPQNLEIVAVDGVPVTDGSGNPTIDSQQSIVLAPGARVEFIVTTPKVGVTAQLYAHSWNNGPDGDSDPGRTLVNVVSSTSTSDGSLPVTSATPVAKIPDVTQSLPTLRFKALNTAAATVQRSLYFSVKSDFSQFYITVAGQTPAVYNMDGPPNIVVNSGTVEQWTISNESELDHAFHIHQIHFRTLAINGTPVTDYTERDTVNIPHWTGSGAYPSVTLLMDFTDPNIVGTFVYHCHILSHEDLGMMGSIQVVAPTSAAPQITSLNRNYGAPYATITLTGSNFGSTQGSSTVAFNGVNASSYSSWSSTSIAAVVPTSATSGNVTVTVGGQTSATSSATAFTVYPDPKITAISPTSGSVGTVVTITGTNMKDGGTHGSVTFNGVYTPYNSVSATSIQVAVPSGASTGPISVYANGAVANSATFTVN